MSTTIGPGAKFSTTLVLELSPADLMPELCVALTNGGAQFTLLVPSRAFDE